MNILKFIESFTTENMMNVKGSRRDIFSQVGLVGKNAALTAIPFGIAALTSTKATAAVKDSTSGNPIAALQLALTLEYLEDEFYQLGLDSGVIPAGGREEKVFMQIAAHESDHVTFLQNGLGANSISKPTFDFTVGGVFDPFNNYAQFLALAQAFEDTGVRAYKGQAANLISTPDLLTAALRIHSVEARHASEVRRLRGLKGWITGSERGAGMPVATQAVYNGEEVTSQAGYDTAFLFGAAAGSEAYDEPLTGPEAVAIASLFIV
ncbi:Ferritin-like domain-containing protein [Flavobacterium gillisiae]|uniref:Ferritin-like domain-containing protein n=1 Tax=Flavobacterium gillisiae TaxID=150146 RepID=A0A1H4FR06_9FLAO|nr:ferritin-like domain-containing protein [Flavobacterium gillisiae]SEA99813.1 Ferritin-like domain-containing protein [Flavobacterium gillisiae]